MQFDPTKPNNLIVMAAQELPTYWHVIKPGLDYMVADKRNPNGWSTAQIFDDLLNKRATCVFTSIYRKKKRSKKGVEDVAMPVFYESRDAAILDSCGFSIVTVVNSNIGKAFHISIAVSNDTTNKDKAPSILTTFKDDVWAMAKDCECTRITFGTNQDWWDQVAPRFNFTKQETIWTVDLD